MRADWPDHTHAAPLRGLTEAPVVSLDLFEPLALGAEFVRWEIATAVAGALLHINPFDEPNVQQAKDATRVLLGAFESSGALPVPPPDQVDAGGATLTLTAAARNHLGGSDVDGFLALLGPGDYFGLLAYVGPDPALRQALDTFRHEVHQRTGAATTIGIGPRYLHSTGQLHKGGANSGVFVLITAVPEADVAIPGEVFSFGTLELAQALGDFNALGTAGRRGLHIHLPSPTGQALSAVTARLLTARLRA
jgi:transaldolase/glucose-6-phosphate isomerase